MRVRTILCVLAYAGDLSIEFSSSGVLRKPGKLPVVPIAVVPIGEADLAPPGPTLSLTKQALRRSELPRIHLLKPSEKVLRSTSVALLISVRAHNEGFSPRFLDP